MSFLTSIKAAFTVLLFLSNVHGTPLSYGYLSYPRSRASDKVPANIDKRAPAFNYNDEKVRGVNLGGWLVLEPWITPSLFELWAKNQNVKDEYTYTQTLGKKEALKRLDKHWRTWITQADFQAIRKAGLNHVRIPIGYWAVTPISGDPYVQGQLAYMDNAIKWARNSALKVMIDLHGAPGSQNGFDNSGRYGDINWQSGDTVQQTLSAIKALISRYAASADVVTAIELLNEPLGAKLDLKKVKDFYNDGYDIVRKSSGNIVVVIQDAFEDVQSYWNGFMNTQSGKQDVMLDTHSYQIFTPDQVSQTPQQHIATACGQAPKFTGTDKWLVVGEWTGAQTDCAKWLNGLGKGARYDGTFGEGSYHVGDCTNKYVGKAGELSRDDKHNLRQFIEAQLDAYESHSGWFFWTWKTESAPEWNMQGLLKEGLFPQPLTKRRYPGQCTKL